MFNFIKSYIEDYKTYKIEKAQDDLILEESLAKHRADMEKRTARREAEDEKKLKENIVYNKESNCYTFSVTVEHNGIQKTFSCENRSEQSCRNIASCVLAKAHMYELFGACGYQEF